MVVIVLAKSLEVQVSQVTYKDAGVDIDAADAFVNAIGPICRATQGREVLRTRSGFGGLFLPDLSPYREPVLVSSTDGVGTKLKLAFATGIHHSVGVDLVAMNVNDILAMGAKPLFFLDYFASSRLDVAVAVDVVRGIAAGCQQAGCALIGGETAELPGFYSDGDYELAGFVVGVAERSQIIDGTSIQPGDQLIGLPSSGFHSNGYSLVRLLISQRQIDLSAAFNEGESWGDALLRPTRIYRQELGALQSSVPVKGIAHITGGGLLENIPRILPEGCAVRLDPTSWAVPDVILRLVQDAVSPADCARTFNMGLGMVVVVSADALPLALDALPAATHVGEVTAGERGVTIDGWA